MEEVKKPFSSRFVDDEKFGKELSLKTRRKYYRFLYLIPLLTGVIALTSTLFGLDLSFGGARVLLFNKFNNSICYHLYACLAVKKRKYI